MTMDNKLDDRLVNILGHLAAINLSLFFLGCLLTAILMTLLLPAK